jgi:glycine cleavage system H protein
MLSKSSSPESGATTKGGKQCIWVKAGVVSYRVCTKNFDCNVCEFSQNMMDGSYGQAGEDMFTALRNLPSEKRHCRYMLTGDVSYKVCPRSYECFHCEVDQRMQDAMDALAEHPFTKKRLAQAKRRTTVREFPMPSDLSFYPGHTWIRAEKDGTVTVGTDSFVVKLLGELEDPILPDVGKYVWQGRQAFAIKQGGRIGRMNSPVTGKVVAMNRLADRTGKDPYGVGWLFKVEPSRLDRDLETMMKGAEAQEWMVAERDRFLDRFSKVSVAGTSTLNDGGTITPGIAGRFGEEDWNNFVDLFLTVKK